jgi:hypothetical protein
VVVTALSQETGKRLWQFGYAYPSPPRTVDADTALLPWSGVPGGAVAVDLVGSGFVTNYVFGDLYGSLWLVDAATGVSRTGTDKPLFSFTTNLHPIGAPPAIYSDGSRQYAAFVSGGYTDPTLTSWTTTTQYIIAVKLDPTATTTVTETTNACVLATCRLTVNTTLNDVGANGDKGFAQALVVGNQLFVMTDTNVNDVNSSSYGSTGNTGHLTTVDLATGTASTTLVVNSGASSLVNNGTALYSASSTKQQKMATNATSTTGATVDLQADSKGQRALWLRTE